MTVASHGPEVDHSEDQATAAGEGGGVSIPQAVDATPYPTGLRCWVCSRPVLWNARYTLNSAGAGFLCSDACGDAMSTIGRLRLRSGVGDRFK